jgi:long-chain acyl-CoA synthetase
LRTPPASRSLLGRAYDRVQWALGVALLNLFPLPREAGFRDSFAFAGETADRGYNILVFPEGRITEDGAIRPFRGGIGLLAGNLGVPVVAMRIDGLFELKQAGKKFARPGKVRIRIGVPVEFPRGSTPEEIARQLQERVEEL